MKKILEKFNLHLFALIVLSGMLRLFNLGYSDYQGDEIKALYLPEEGEGFFSFILDQRKGPLQFVITYFIKLVDSDYSDRFLARFFFAAAGVIAVYLLYKLVEAHFGKLAAGLASFFLATNGLFVAFSRIVQYQSFVICFSLAALYLFTLSLKIQSFRHRGVIWGFVLWAVALLAHYDAVFIAPFALYLLVVWFVRYYETDKKAKRTLIFSIILAISIVLAFYIPFVFSISKSTLAYWSGRISGEVSSKVSSSRYLFSVYQPIYIIHFYTIATILGLLYLYYYSFGVDRPKGKGIKKYLIYLSLGAWFLAPLVFMEKMVSIPGTHIYTYLIPLFIIMALGLKGIYELLEQKFSRGVYLWAYQVVLAIVFTFTFLQSYAIFVDNNQEYPWQEEKFLIWTFPKPTPIYHLSLFGFPYYRNWDGIGQFIKQYAEITYYSTNERKALVRYHIPLDKDTNKAGFYIHVKYPQTFSEAPTNEKSAYWMENYQPIFTLTKNGQDLVRMYIMEPGSLDEILAKGY